MVAPLTRRVPRVPYRHIPAGGHSMRPRLSAPWPHGCGNCPTAQPSAFLRRLNRYAHGNTNTHQIEHAHESVSRLFHGSGETANDLPQTPVTVNTTGVSMTRTSPPLVLAALAGISIGPRRLRTVHHNQTRVKVRQHYPTDETFTTCNLHQAIREWRYLVRRNM
jgi:hypothetical protein